MVVTGGGRRVYIENTINNFDNKIYIDGNLYLLSSTKKDNCLTYSIDIFVCPAPITYIITDTTKTNSLEDENQKGDVFYLILFFIIILVVSVIICLYNDKYNNN